MLCCCCTRPSSCSWSSADCWPGAGRAWHGYTCRQLSGGAFVELSGAGCPLTALENEFLAKAGLAGYGGGFIEHHLLGAIYPGGLTRSFQAVLDAAVVLINLAVYAAVVRANTGRRK